ncbi:hypothetical protein J2Z83_001566 [Virgibacillus natechei]|uniref:Transposase n=1 Tax=Virgibacillus natechei TaxID=1216297 RepID=A0ABS4IEV8_9BACI|nr:hypothetical protein [Virgibacillus natechei]MBP1969462.1 hypothetical protein [Virgibacillus natechei]UZD15002.1 hypothetical protein OLD84_12860 [Virgibacillus natechei]
MERLHERLQSAEKALDTFQEIVDIKTPSLIQRDAGISAVQI